MNLKHNLSLLFCFMLIGITVYSQSQTVMGKVTDGTTNEGLPGATIMVKGTTTGTITDFDGNYSLQVANGDTLIISFIGYTSQELAVGTEVVLDVVLGLNVSELEEIVVVGYGKVEKGDVTGVVNKIDSKSFNQGVVASPEGLLSGKVAGVQISPSGGAPGGQSSIRLRGGTSLNASNEPLFVVDGVPLENSPHNPSGLSGGRSPLSFINPADIADITVLKDASAAAIYGSRGANGVIIITTKSGTSGQLKINYDGNVAFNFLNRETNMLSTEEFIFTVQRRGPKFIETLGSEDTNWYNEVTQVPISTNHNLSASFGGKSNSGRVSLNYQQLQGVLLTSQNERFAGSVNLTQKLLNDDLVVNLNVKSSISNDRFAPGIIRAALKFDPTQPVNSEDPSTGFYYEHEAQLGVVNPVSSLMQTFDIGRNVRNLASIKATYNLPIEGMSMVLSYAYDRSDGARQRTELETLKSAADESGRFIHENLFRDSNLFESYLNYSPNIENTNIRLDLAGGYSYQDFYREAPRFEKLPGVHLKDLGLADRETIVEGDFYQANPNDYVVPLFDRVENRLISFWGRANLHIRDRYLVTATLRRDGSTRFGENNRWGLFPSLALGWRIMDEPFAESLDGIFSDLKARVSWGVTGSQEIADFLYVNLYERGDPRASYVFGDRVISVLRPNAVDTNIKWEETSSLNLGIDYGLFEGRLYGSIDLYRKNTTDLLSEIAFAAGTLTGDVAVTNIGEMINSGVEFLANTVIIDNETIGWDLSFNAAYNRNEIARLDNSEGIGYRVGNITGGGFGEFIQIVRVGEPAYSFYTLKHRRDGNGNPLPDGVDHNGDGIENQLDIYEDINADGIINEDDLQVGESPWPDLIMGVTSNMRYKKFDLSMTLRSQIGNYVYNNVSSENGAYLGVNGAFAPNNINVSAYTNDFREYQVLSDVYVENASFLRLDNISVGYSFEMSEKINSRAYLTLSNLFTLTGYSGFDPEVGAVPGAADPNVIGLDQNLYPLSRMVMVGLNINFN